MSPYLFEIGQIVQTKIIHRGGWLSAKGDRQQAQILQRWVVEPTGEIIYHVRTANGETAKLLQCEIEAVPD